MRGRLTRRRVGAISIAAVAAAAAGYAQAEPHPGLADLSPIKPALTCEALAKTDLSHIADTPASISATRLIDSPRGPYCQVRGVIQPAIRFEVDLPVNHWTQRYLQTGCGGLCGTLHVGVEHAAGCAPAADGELAVASDDMGHESHGMGDAEFGADPKRRIDFAYRGNHATALVAKALIKAFYGQAPRYSYFSGCSDGGREALVEAQRYPTDFDGIAAGAPAMNFQVQNSFYHAWQARSNTGPDGKAILIASRLPILHRAALAACDALDGQTDGLISDPRACRFDPAAAACKPGATDASDCLTPAEVEAARRLYAGPTDAAGHHFTIGGPQPGSELSWAGVYVPDAPDGAIMSRGAASGSFQYVILPQVSSADGDIDRFAFTEANFARLEALHPLYDATNTDLAPFETAGGKLILWHGWSDPHISPINTIAYYHGVQSLLGADRTRAFARLFLLPGMYHCFGGDGFGEFDVLTPLMAWVETGRAPDVVVASQMPDMPKGPPPMAMMTGDHAPLPMPAPPALRTRPIFAYPKVATYAGQGDPNRADSYVAADGRVADPDHYDWEGAKFMAPDNQLAFTVKDGALAPAGRP